MSEVKVFKTTQANIDTYLRLGIYTQNANGEIFSGNTRVELVGTNEKAGFVKPEDNANEGNPLFNNINAGLNGGYETNLNSVNKNTFNENVDAGIKAVLTGTETGTEKGDKFSANLKDIQRKRLAKYGRKKQGGVLRYPAELLTEHADYLQIDIERYEAIGSSYVNRAGGNDRYVTGNIVTNRAGRTNSTRLSRKPLINAGTILLPIPAQLQDSNNVVYGDSKLNGLAAAGVEAIGGSMARAGTVSYTHLTLPTKA